MKRAKCQNQTTDFVFKYKVFKQKDFVKMLIIPSVILAYGCIVSQVQSACSVKKNVPSHGHLDVLIRVLCPATLENAHHVPKWSG